VGNGPLTLALSQKGRGNCQVALVFLNFHAWAPLSLSSFGGEGWGEEVVFLRRLVKVFGARDPNIRKQTP
jgi:hypothetical protein